MKELPYFRFTAQEWQNGDISLETYELKGLFIDVCSYYWVKDCSIAKTLLEKRYRNDITLLNQLFDLGIIKHNTETDFIQITFLDEQFDVLSEARKRRQSAGSKGGKMKSSNAKAMLKQSSSYKDKDKDNNKDKDKIKEEIIIPVVEKFSFLKSLLASGADKQLASDYLQVRKTKKLAATKTAYNNFIDEVQKSKRDINEVLKICIVKGWGGFKHTWEIDNNLYKTNQNGAPQTKNEKSLQ